MSRKKPWPECRKIYSFMISNWQQRLTLCCNIKTAACSIWNVKVNIIISYFAKLLTRNQTLTASKDKNVSPPGLFLKNQTIIMNPMLKLNLFNSIWALYRWKVGCCEENPWIIWNEEEVSFTPTLPWINLINTHFKEFLSVSKRIRLKI